MPEAPLTLAPLTEGRGRGGLTGSNTSILQRRWTASWVAWLDSVYRTGRDGCARKQTPGSGSVLASVGIFGRPRPTHLLVGSSENVRSGAFARRPHGFHGRSPQQVGDQIQLA